MTMVSPRVDSLSDEELTEIVRGFPGDLPDESPAEWAYLMAYIRETIWTSASFEHTDLYIDLVHRFPRPLDHYRQAGEDARWRRLDRKWRVRQQMISSAGVRR